MKKKVSILLMAFFIILMGRANAATLTHQLMCGEILVGKINTEVANGQTVTLRFNNPGTVTFEGWQIVSGSGTFSPNNQSEIVNFTMPESGDVLISAVYSKGTYPTLASKSTWYKGTTAKSTITQINIVNTYTPTGTVTESWNADVDNSGTIKCYIQGTKLTIAGNGSGKILANVDSANTFKDFNTVTSINGVNLLNTSNVTDMSGMFFECSSLTELDVSKFNTSNVTDMSYMFFKCSSLTELDVSKFNTSNVTDMSYMFNGCSNLTELDVREFDTSIVTAMANMFQGSNNLTILDLSNFNTSNVTNMYAMFAQCENLTELNLSSFNTIKVTSIGGMFEGCCRLSTITLGANFSFSGNGSTNCTLPNPSSMYITGANGNWYTSDGTMYSWLNVPSNRAATYYAVKPAPTLAGGDTWYKGTTTYQTITQINIVDSYTPTGTVTESWNADVDNSGTIKCYIEGTKLTIAGNGSGKIYAHSNSSGVFTSFIYVTSISGLEKLDTSKATSMSRMFSGCNRLSSIDVSGFDTSNVRYMNSMFYECRDLSSVDVSGFDTSNVTDMGSMFYKCISLSSVDVSRFDTSNVTHMESMFYQCTNLSSVDVSGFNTSNVTNMNSMFDGCSKLSTVKLGANFSFTGNGSTSCTLPTPSSTYITGADGNWYTADGTVYVPANVPSNTAATYYAVKP